MHIELQFLIDYHYQLIFLSMKLFFLNLINENLYPQTFKIKGGKKECHWKCPMQNRCLGKKPRKQKQLPVTWAFVLNLFYCKSLFLLFHTIVSNCLKSVGYLLKHTGSPIHVWVLFNVLYLSKTHCSWGFCFWVPLICTY